MDGPLALESLVVFSFRQEVGNQSNWSESAVGPVEINECA
jgi:hypothetical protein